MREITTEQIHRYKEDFYSDPRNMITMNAVTANGVLKCARNVDTERRDINEFSVLLKSGEITNQKKSGRCWMFAALNVVRYQIMKSLKLETFELSENFVYFYDKLEKANYFLENILETLDEPGDSRLIAWLLESPVADGGQWDMIVSLIEKYGIVPKYAMPETTPSSESAEMNAALTEKLRGYACVLRREYKNGESVEELRGRKDDMIDAIYRMLCVCLGCPPESFDLEVRDKDHKYVRDTNLTPVDFYRKYAKLDLSQFVSLINAPTENKPFHRSYGVRFLGNVRGGRPVRYLNLEIGELKEAAIRQLEAGLPVWFGSEVSRHFAREGGILDAKIFDRGALFNTDFTMTKAERLDYGQSKMTHAMVFLGVNLDEDGKPNRWKVENSWGKDRGKEGYLLMSDDWFTENLYQIVVDRKFLPEKLIEEYEAEPIMLEPWDPMGSLAD